MDLCLSLMLTLNWILYEPIWSDIAFAFASVLIKMNLSLGYFLTCVVLRNIQISKDVISRLVELTEQQTR